MKPQAMRVTCPRCRQPIIVQVQSVVDVGQDPNLKALLLQGRINVATCPACGNEGTLDAPLLYHDPEKGLLLCYVPMELGLAPEERERLIGRLTASLIESLPPEERKGYLLQPKVILTMTRLMEEILAADGITREMIAARARKLRLLDQLLACQDDGEGLRRLVKEERERLDHEFFLMLSASIDRAREDGDEELAQRLMELRGKIVSLTASWREALPLKKMTREELIRRLADCRDEARLKRLVAANRPVLDQLFFQDLADRIDQAQMAGRKKEAQRLKKMRANILNALLAE